MPITTRSRSNRSRVVRFRTRSQNDTKPLDGMVVTSYGKGYLLVPHASSSRIGQKYFYGGWWNPSLNAWFFKRHLRSKLLSLGATSSSTCSSSSPTKNFSSSEDLSSMTLSPYGRGYLLIPQDGDSRIGQKYFQGGWWMPSQGAWFFRKEVLAQCPSTYSPTTTPSTVSPSKNQFSGMVVESYGKGYLLVPDGDHQDEGVKNYFGGWWMPKYGSWFFKAHNLELLLSHGATLEEQTTSTDSSSPKPFQGMLLEPYKRGLLLIPPSSSHRVGQKYFYGGWWMANQSGWIFRRSSKKQLLEGGAKTI